MARRVLPEPSPAHSRSARQRLEHRQDHLPDRSTMWDKTEETIPLECPSPWGFCPCCHTAAPQVTHGSCWLGSILSWLQEGCCLLGRGLLFLAGTRVRGPRRCQYTDGTAWGDEEVQSWQRQGKAASNQWPGKDKRVIQRREQCRLSLPRQNL